MTPRRAHLGAGTLAAAVLVLVACQQPAPGEPDQRSDAERVVVQVSDAEAATDVVSATEAFGLTMLASGDADSNVVTSPASAVVALAMLAEGARGVSEAELDALLGASGPDRTDAVGALLAALQEHDGDPALAAADELPETPLAHLANQIVLDEGFEVRAEFLDTLAAGYGAGIATADLATRDGVRVLGAWVREHTGGLIPGSAIEPKPELRLVLQNVVVLAARWESPFDASDTRDVPFAVRADDVPLVRTMHGLREVPYAEVDGWRAARVPYAEAFSADLVLPPDGVDPADVPAGTLGALVAALDAAQPVEVELAVPALDLPPARLALAPAIEAAGAASLLDPDTADLTGIDDDLFVGQAVQQAMLRMDEEGTVAAAVTEIGVELSSGEAPRDARELSLDRPYLVRIAHDDTGWPLFVAAIRDPRG
ncbi:proteinase inhibitor I4 serpin [Beutenbergia cavernae DSM 12333]|uniref:Proteinase inhibitor I4 serpin n=1 Tax=Beutenbergia cavernae (strain ATCC BAA-8 / DSM 12333 / CCUG 43141 / JCM 11478 / NBRC 16432 / NCIMB 13614 / HKI 0122) TaxID=471853 RepID=C5C5L1_BEUC1|nr:serpin family protein [Beutenbergia cavernae]ACQ80202.1 proteinase inhibitor I4 serpin [Beutenbergia cavernae DSM 12333]